MEKIKSGNFNDIVKNRKGNPWVIGHFIEEDSLLKSSDIEIKWAFHHKGDSKSKIVSNIHAKTLCFLIRGRVSLIFPDCNQNVSLKKEGDFRVWDGGVNHTWEVLEDSLIITVRWPSIPNDQSIN